MPSDDKPDMKAELKKLFDEADLYNAARKDAFGLYTNVTPQEEATSNYSYHSGFVWGFRHAMQMMGLDTRLEQADAPATEG